MKNVVLMKSMEERTVSHKADVGEMTPAGISLDAVRGLRASYFRSINRLKAIAAVRANTIQRIT